MLQYSIAWTTPRVHTLCEYTIVDQQVDAPGLPSKINFNVPDGDFDHNYYKVILIILFMILSMLLTISEK